MHGIPDYVLLMLAYPKTTICVAGLLLAGAIGFAAWLYKRKR
jgi:hypothetical protein